MTEKTLKSEKEQIIDLINLAFEVDEKTNHDIFIRYSGHVNLLHISYHPNGWKTREEMCKRSNEIEIFKGYLGWNTKNPYIQKSSQKLKRLLKEGA